MKAILGFDYLLTPRVLVFFYWIVMLVILIAGVYSMFTDHLITGFIGMIFSLIGCRVTFEADHGCSLRITNICAASLKTPR